MEAVVRAKFVVTQVTEYEGGSGKTVKLEPRYSKSIPEDKVFAQATPSGEMTMYVNNTSALEHLKPGAVFYLDFVPAPEGTSRFQRIKVRKV